MCKPVYFLYAKTCNEKAFIHRTRAIQREKSDTRTTGNAIEQYKYCGGKDVRQKEREPVYGKKYHNCDSMEPL